MDFVADAFFSLKVNHEKVTRSGFARDSAYYRNLKVHKSYSNGDLNYEYSNYMNVIYENFVNSYLDSPHRANKITDYKSFINEFLTYALRICEKYPITRTGFITSVHCSPFVGGLMLEVASESHGLLHADRIAMYTDDPYYDYWVKQTSKFGFMVDRNAPWRLVFNLGSGHPVKPESPPRGAQLFMGRYGVSYENVFEYRYRKAHRDEIVSLKKQMSSLYKDYYQQFGTYEEMCPSGLKRISKPRDAPNLWGVATGFDGLLSRKDLYARETEYWLKILLKLRMVETKEIHTTQQFNATADEMIRRFRLSGTGNGYPNIDVALDFINDLTKGFYVTNFNMRGKNWHGVSKTEHRRRMMESLRKANDASQSQYSLTLTKNMSGR